MVKLVESNEVPVVLGGNIYIVEINNFVSSVEIIPTNVEDIDPTKAYIVSPYVLPIVNLDKFEEGGIGIYVDGEELKYNMPKTEEDKEKFSVDKIRELEADINRMVREMIENPDNFRSEKDAEIINLNANITTYSIKDDDDFLKKGIKQAINDKGINVRSYGDKLPKAHDISNISGALGRDSKMTVPNFAKWCSILGLKCEIIISDNGEDTVKPLPEDIHIMFND